MKLSQKLTTMNPTQKAFGGSFVSKTCTSLDCDDLILSTMATFPHSAGESNTQCTLNIRLQTKPLVMTCDLNVNNTL